MKAVKHVSFNDVKEITLLTAEQAERLPNELRARVKWWWLRSPGGYHDYVAYVYVDGAVYYTGNYVCNDFGCVRPAFSVPNLNLDMGEKVHIGGYRYTLNGDYIGGCVCTVIDKDLLLADNVVCRHRFDAKSNDWETSELKTFIESDEFVKILEGGKFNVD